MDLAGERTFVKERVVDSHAHFWRRRPEDSGAGDGTAMSCAELVELMDSAGVDMTLQLSRVDEPDDGHSLDGAVDHPGRFRVIGRSPRESFTDPIMLRHWFADSPFVGMRLFDSPFPLELLGEGGNRFWREVASLECPVTIYRPDRLAEIRWVASRHPDVTLVLDHACVLVKGEIRGDEAFRHWHAMLELADLPNVYVKASALPDVTNECFPFSHAQERLQQVAEVFSAERVMWGSNFTGAGTTGAGRRDAYRERVEFARQAVQRFSPVDQDSILGGTAERLFRPQEHD